MKSLNFISSTLMGMPINGFIIVYYSHLPFTHNHTHTHTQWVRIQSNHQNKCSLCTFTLLSIHLNSRDDKCTLTASTTLSKHACLFDEIKYSCAFRWWVVSTLYSIALLHVSIPLWPTQTERIYFYRICKNRRKNTFYEIVFIRNCTALTIRENVYA